MNEYAELAIEADIAPRHAGDTTPLTGGLQLTTQVVTEKGKRPCGRYYTLAIPEAKGWDREVEKGIAHTLRLLLKAKGLRPRRTLVAGLGNRRILCDRLGTDTVDCLTPTSRLYAFCPMVKQVTGLDSADTIAAVRAVGDCDLVVAVDALVCRDPVYLMRTVELSDAGLTPGGGVGLPQKGLTEASLGAPICYVGVPMLSFVDPFVPTLCVTTEDVERKSATIAERLAAAIAHTVG